MKNQKGLTLLEVVVTIVIIMVLLAILMPMHGRRYGPHRRVVCGTNLKGLGTAQVVYANDYDDKYAIQGGDGAPAWTTATDEVFNPDKDWSKAKGITVGASLYLLVREADVSPKSFVCPSSSDKAYDGAGTGRDIDITQIWDFGMFTTDRVKKRDDGIGNTHGPKNHVSYSYQMPYGPKGGAGRYAADGTKPASYAVMADKNPWYDPKLTADTVDAENWVSKVAELTEDWGGQTVLKYLTQVANSEPHDRDGQNVMFGDGHNAYEKRTDVGVKHDNIYTRRGVGGSESDIRIGDAGEMARYTVDNAWQPRDAGDSFLVNDDSRLPPYPAP